jgi:hypothetical protein
MFVDREGQETKIHHEGTKDTKEGKAGKRRKPAETSIRLRKLVTLLRAGPAARVRGGKAK